MKSLVRTMYPLSVDRSHLKCATPENVDYFRQMVIEQLEVWKMAADKFEGTGLSSAFSFPDLIDVAAILLMDLSTLATEGMQLIEPDKDSDPIPGLEGLPRITTFKKHIAAVNSKNGFSSGEQRAAERQPVWDEWQADADELWGANPRLSAAEVGRRIASRRGKGENPDTIRRQIRKT